MFIDVYITKGIDSSFVSAVMDTIMATATVFAVLAAKNYLRQFTAQEGYKIAIELVNVHFREIDKLKELDESYNKLLKFIKDNRKILPNKQHTTMLEIVLTSFRKNILSFKEFVKKHDSYIFELRTYGLSVSFDKLSTHNAMKEELNKISKMCDELLEKACEIKLLIENTISENTKKNKKYEQENEGVMFTLSRFKHIDIDSTLELTKVVNKAMSHYELFIGDDNSVVKLFTVK